MTFILKTALAICLVITYLNSTFAIAETRETKAENNQILTIEQGYSPYIKGFGVWRLDEDWSVVGLHTCSRELLWDWWPSEPKCEGRLYIGLDVRKANGEFDLEKSLRAKRWAFGGGPSFKLHVEGKNANWTELYDVLRKQEVSIISVNGYQFELKDFLKVAGDDYTQERKKASSAVTDERIRLIFNAVAVLAVLVALGAALRWAYKKIPIVASSLKVGVKTAVGEVKDMQVRRVARDEVIRQTARDVLADASEGEKAALRSQIELALENGDNDLATTLASVLKKMEKS